jgi:hypothetical protein
MASRDKFSDEQLAHIAKVRAKKNARRKKRRALRASQSASKLIVAPVG